MVRGVPLRSGVQHPCLVLPNLIGCVAGKCLWCQRAGLGI